MFPARHIHLYIHGDFPLTAMLDDIEGYLVLDGWEAPNSSKRLLIEEGISNREYGYPERSLYRSKTTS